MGFIAFRLMKSITDFQTIVLVSLSLVMSISVVATYLDLSIPLAVVSAGLFMGNRTINLDEKERSNEALEKFWQPWQISRAEILQDPEKPLSFLLNEDGEFRTLI